MMRSAHDCLVLGYPGFGKSFQRCVALVSELLYKAYVGCVIAVRGQVLHGPKESRALIVMYLLVGGVRPI